MPRFKIIPTERPSCSTEVEARDPGAVLSVVQRLGYGDADVLTDGVYSFSLRLDDNRVWSILRRDHEVDPLVLPLLN